jgi:phenylacetate-CoA ligase
VFVYDRRAWMSVIASIVRSHRLLGLAPQTRSLVIGAPSPIHISNRISAELRAGRSGAPVLDVTMPVSHVVEALNDYQPEIFTTYPSFIRVLAGEQQSGRLRISPRFVRSGAETLTTEVRELARAAWDALVINSYSSTEVGHMGQQCPYTAGVIHLGEDLAVYEVADEHDRPLPAGARGAKLLVTTLTNPTLPIIRYELTDIITLAAHSCRCGSPFACIESIEGRREEVLRFPRLGGGFLDVPAIRLHNLLIGTEGIHQFQFVQLPSGLELSVAVLPGVDPEAARLKAEYGIRAVLEKLGAAPAKVDVRIVDGIARVGSGAKEKLVTKASGPTPP